MSFNRRLTFLAVAALVFTVACPRLVFAQADTASAIDSAKKQIVICFEAARAAEAAGANITSLTAVLNDAGALLSSAEPAYASGNSTAASTLVSQSVERLDGFVAAADALRLAAQQQGSFDFWVYFVGSIMGSLVILGGGYVLWIFLSRRYREAGAACE